MLSKSSRIFSGFRKLNYLPQANFYNDTRSYIGLILTPPEKLIHPEYEAKREKYYEDIKQEINLAVSTTKPDKDTIKHAYISAGLMTVPYLLFLPNLVYAWLANTEPIWFLSSTLARSMLKWISINIAMSGGVHFGLSEIYYETQPGPKESLQVALQLIYSFIPAGCAFFITNTILLSSAVTTEMISAGFLSLISLQIASWIIDIFSSKQKLLPRWYAKHRIVVTAFQILMTLTLFFVYYKYPQRTRLEFDPNRLEWVKSKEDIELDDQLKFSEDEYENIEGIDIEEILLQQKKL